MGDIARAYNRLAAATREVRGRTTIQKHAIAQEATKAMDDLIAALWDVGPDGEMDEADQEAYERLSRDVEAV
jgi:hypothetical protein